MTYRACLIALTALLYCGNQAVGKASIRDILDSARSEHSLSAMGAIIIKNGQISEPVVVGQIGVGLPAPVQQDARWHLGSCTKSMTAMLIGVFVERGDLNWDTPLKVALAETDITLHKDFEEVTIEQLLGHRAGLAKDLIKQPIWGTLRNGQLTPTQQRHLISKTYLESAPALPPGTEFKYSNAGYVIAGLILEQLEGQAFEQIMAEQLFEPLGLASAGFGPPVGDTQPRGHKLFFPLPPEHVWSDNPMGLAPAGCVHMSLNDWARYALVHLQAARGEAFRMLTEQTYQRLQTPLNGQNYALGWGRPTRDWTHGPALSHAGSNTMWRAQIWVLPERNAAILVTTNHGAQPAKQAIQDVIRAIRDRL